MKVTDLVQEQTQQDPVQAAQARIKNIESSIQTHKEELARLQKELPLARQALRTAQDTKRQSQQQPPANKQVQGGTMTLSGPAVQGGTMPL